MPIDKPCGEGLMPDGLAALERLGIWVNAENSYPFPGICFRRAGPAVGAAIRVAPANRRACPQSGNRLFVADPRDGYLSGWSSPGKPPRKRPMDHWSRRKQVASAALGRTRCFSKKRLPLRVSATLSRGALDGPHGTLLGPARRNLRHAGFERSSLRSADFSRSQIAADRGIASIPRIEVPAGGCRCCFYRERRRS